MMNKLLLIGFLLVLASCKGGNKAPVLETDMNRSAEGHSATIENQKLDIAVDPEEGILTISQLLSDRKKYEGKVVVVKGEVTKFNPAIMGKNWVHIQDGTEYSGEYDLTITTPDEVKVGEVVVFKGVIALDRDFGYGYTYSTLVEEAILRK